MSKATGGPAQPSVSVVIAVHNGGADLEKCLAAVRASSYPVLECILVDDASTDGKTVPAASKYDAHLISVGRQGGPAAARNLGVSEATGDIVFFTDADVLLHTDAIAVAVDTLQADTRIDAVFGSYDDQPTHASFVSQYRNLFHHWVHQTGAEEAFTFWTGCGAIRRKAFMEMGGFSPDFGEASIEDIELGMRLRHAGHRIRLVKDMYCAHMKHWRFWNMLRTDTLMRAVPWMLLVLRESRLTNDLNLNYRSRAATVLAALTGLVLLTLMLTGHYAALLPIAVFTLVTALYAGVYDSKAQRTATNPLVTTLAFAAPLAAYLLVPDPLAAIPPGLLLAMVATHLDFYRYVAQKRGVAFAIAMAPMQFLFFMGCAISIPLALTRHYLAGRQAVGKAPGRES